MYRIAIFSIGLLMYSGGFLFLALTLDGIGNLSALIGIVYGSILLSIINQKN